MESFYTDIEDAPEKNDVGSGCSIFIANFHKSNKKSGQYARFPGFNG
jgi:hypothetical protein